MKIKISFLFAWYDLWIGLFWDAKKKWLYILPIPMVGFIIKFSKKVIDIDDPTKPWNLRKGIVNHRLRK